MTYLECLESPGIICSPDPNIPTTLLSKEDRALFQLCIESACRLTYILSGSLDAHPAQRSALTFSEWFARPDISAAFKFHYSNMAIFDQYADQVRNKVARAVLVTATMESEHVFKHLPINSSNVPLLERAVRESRLAAAKLDSTTKYARPQNSRRRTSKSQAASRAASRATGLAPQTRVPCPTELAPSPHSESHSDTSTTDQPSSTAQHSALIAPWAHENCRGAQRDGASQHASPRTTAPTHNSALGADDSATDAMTPAPHPQSTTQQLSSEHHSVVRECSQGSARPAGTAPPLDSDLHINTTPSSHPASEQEPRERSDAA